MLRHRLLFGPVLIALVVGVFWLDAWLDAQPISGFLSRVFMGRDTLPPGIAMFLMALAVSPFAGFELGGILRANDIPTSRRATWAAVVIGLVVSCVIPIDMPGNLAASIVSTAAAGVLVGSLVFFARGRSVEGVVAATGGVLFAFVYLGLLFGFLLALRRDTSAWVVLAVLLVTKSCDIGAYFTGRAIGRHKLIPWLSPGKTWEGLGGGVAFATALGVLGAWLTQRFGVGIHLELWAGAVCGAAFAVFGQGGDLIASLLKRDAGIKDSSTLLPGFGGVLDVIDSPLLVAPVAYWLLLTFATTVGP